MNLEWILFDMRPDIDILSGIYYHVLFHRTLEKQVK